MKKMLLVALMLMVAGTAFAATPKKHVKCDVKGKIQRVETAFIAGGDHMIKTDAGLVAKRHD